MRSLRKLLMRLGAMLKRERLERDLDDEIAFHMDMQVRGKVESGMSREEAERAVRREFGRPLAVKEQCRDVRLLVWLESVWQDVRFGARALTRAPGFTAVAVLSLALGIGATTTVYTAVQAVLLRDLPYRDPARLVSVRTTIAAFPDWERRTQALQSLAAITFWGSSQTTVWPRSQSGPVDGAAERIEVVSVTLRTLDVLGIQPAIGRGFESSDLGRPTVVISDRLWRRFFDADPNIIGSPLRSARDPELAGAIVIGVMPPGFYTRMHPGDNAFRKRDVWRLVVPSALNPTNTRFTLVGRLRPEASIGQAQAELETIWSQVESTDPAHAEWRQSTYGDAPPQVKSLEVFVTGERDETLWTLFAAVGLVLLIACANVACLLLGRAESRRGEIAARVALGAGRLRLVRQLLTESFLIAALGGLAGAALTIIGVSQFRSIAPDLQFGGFLEAIRVDAVTFGFAALCAVAAVALFGLAPAVGAARTALSNELREGSRRSISGSRGRLRRIMVVTEIGLSLALVIGAGLMLRTLGELLFEDLGFRTANILVVPDAAPAGDRYTVIESGGEESSIRVLPAYFEFFESLLERVEKTPGVISAAFNATFPARVGATYGLRAVGAPAEDEEWSLFAQYHPVTRDYFETLGIGLLRGRLFTGVETEADPWQAILSRQTATRLFGDEDPIGWQVQFRILDFANPSSAPVFERPRTVIGVVDDVGYTWRRRNEHWAVVYLPYRQILKSWPGRAHWPVQRRSLVIRTASDDSAATVSTAVRDAIQAADPQQIVDPPTPLSAYIEGWVAQERFWVQLLGLFAALALFLAAIGLYGTISYSSARRTHEFGIRMALGARPGNVLRIVLSEAAWLAGIGLALGTFASVLLTRFLSSELHGVEPTDPLTFVAAALLLGGVAVLASYLPARRATKIDPLAAVRHE